MLETIIAICAGVYLVDKLLELTITGNEKAIWGTRIALYGTAVFMLYKTVF